MRSLSASPAERAATPGRLLGIVVFGWAALWLAGRYAPAPEGLWRHARKLGEMLASLLTIQVLGAYFARRFGSVIGRGLSAFLGGLISSTATTAEIAKRSRSSRSEDVSPRLMLEFLSANTAMILEAFAIAAVGTEIARNGSWIVFVAPLAVCVFGLRRESRLASGLAAAPLPRIGGFASTFKLALALVGLTAVSYYGVEYFGSTGIYAVTLLASFFEVHAVTMTNSALHGAGKVSDGALGGLFALSLAASLVAKAFLVSTIGERKFARGSVRWTAALMVALVAGWLISALVSASVRLAN